MNICRICLYTDPKSDIAQLTLQAHETVEKQSYQEILEFCLGIQVTANEKISTKLCGKCYSKIIEFYQFKALALRNDAHLRSVEFETVALFDDAIKKEHNISEGNVSENENHYQENEPLIYVKEECYQEHLYDDDFYNEFIDVKDDDQENVAGKPKVRGQQRTRVKQGIGKSTPNELRRGRKPRERIDVSSDQIKRICDICGKEVKDLKQHQLQHMPMQDRGKVECDMCGKILASKPSLKKHIRTRHLNITVKCHVCGKSVKALDPHIKQVHNRELLPFECVPCGRRFISNSALNVHMTIHTKDTPFECEICGKRFRGRATLLMHKRQVHDKERSHMCQFCSKRFFKKCQLQIHIRKHTKEKPHECSICNKRFICSSGLKYHLLVHGGEKKYNCTLCDMSFVSPKYLTTHMISHTKDKKYPCQYCNVRFHRSDHRKRHEYTAHLKHTLTNTTTDS